MPAVVLALVLTLPQLACGRACPTAVEPVSETAGLDGDVDYLQALRQAVESEHSEAAAHWLQDREAYAHFAQARQRELADHPYLARFPAWTAAQRKGWDTWFHWTGGNQLTWRDLAQRSEGRLDLLRLLDNRLLPREERFARFGLINDPDTVAPLHGADGDCQPDVYGLCLDRVEVVREGEESLAWLGRPSGILGLRLFPNPDFQLTATWDATRPFTPPAGCAPGARPVRDAAAVARASREDCYQPPYVVGMTCGFCHISFDPEHPPDDVTAPGWGNLAGALGNIYLREGQLFSWVLDFGADDFYTHVLESQPPGTSDTSRLATDDLDNPGAINGIFHLDARLATAATETLPNGRASTVPHVLKDGADSVGVALAALRVYVNIGMLGNLWLTKHDAYLLLGGTPRPQEPFDLRAAMVTADYAGQRAWNHTEARMDDVAAYLSTVRAFRLADAEGGARFLETDPAVLDRGRLTFADHCAGCHSSVQPAVEPDDQPAWRQAMRALVRDEDFLRGNFLSDDARYPAAVVGVNLTRSMGTNALSGQIWNDFSSLDYKRLPAIGAVALQDPFAEEASRTFCPPAGGRGYYRTASLVSLWATAPFFHNNSVGRHVHDPSLEARMAAFDDATTQLLWPAQRTDPAGEVGPYIKRTGDQVSWLSLPSGLEVPVPPHYPIKMVANLPLHALAEKLPQSLLERLTAGQDETRQARKERIVREVLGNDTLRALLRKVLLDVNGAPDFVENRGHESIVARISDDADKHALIAYLRTL